VHLVGCTIEIIRFIEYRRMKWVGDVAHMGRREMHTEFWWGTHKD